MANHPALAARLRKLVPQDTVLEPLLWRARGRQIALIDYEVTHSPRYGYGKPAHPRLFDLISSQDAATAEVLRAAVSYLDDFARIPARAPEITGQPEWDNVWLPPLDLVANYTLLREHRPARYLEIGSGESTKVARRAVDDGGLETTIVSIDPQPRAEVDILCDRVHRHRLEEDDLSAFAELQAGDVVFFDGSHRSFMNSDVTVFFLEVLPELADGVLVGIHDIHLPWDYPPDWAKRWYNESYVLATYLLCRRKPDQIVFPSHHVQRTPELDGILAPIWELPALRGIDKNGGAFWMTAAQR